MEKTGFVEVRTTLRGIIFVGRFFRMPVVQWPTADA